MLRIMAKFATATAVGFVFLLGSVGSANAKEVVTSEQCQSAGGVVIFGNLCVAGAHNGATTVDR
jgi:hypothetical protein